MNNMRTEPVYSVSLRCYFDRAQYTLHRQDMPLKDIQRWIDAYQFTHPNCQSIVVKIWLKEEMEA